MEPLGPPQGAHNAAAHLFSVPHGAEHAAGLCCWSRRWEGVSAPPSAPHPAVPPHRHKQEAAEEQEEEGSAAERLSSELAGAGGPERR